MPGARQGWITAGAAALVLTSGCSGEETDRPGIEAPACELDQGTGQVEQYGIRWVFGACHQTGLFANGDYWVVGPVTLTRIDPGYDGEAHGWEVNPSFSESADNPFLGVQGFDARIPVFDPTLVPALPYVASPGESIVKAVSQLDWSDPERQCEGGFEHWCLRTAAVLTVLAEAPPEDAFRPPYVGEDKPLYRVAGLRTDSLPSLPRVPEAPSVDWVADRFQRLQMNHEPGNTGRCISPIDNFHPDHRYGPSLGIEHAEAALTLLLDDPLPDKMPGLIRYVQVGIDWGFAVRQGKSWTAGGPGIQPGFKVPIAFAATLLGDDELQAIVSQADFPERAYLQPHATLAGRALFGREDPYSADPEQAYWEYLIAKDAGEDVSTSAIKDPYGTIDGELPEEGYAVNIFPHPWKGAALSAILLPEMQSVWNNALLFDYVDRNVEVGRWTQPDPCAPHDGDRDHYGATFGPDGQGGCILDDDPSDGTGRYPELHGQHRDPPVGEAYASELIDAMWAAYRNGY